MSIDQICEKLEINEFLETFKQQKITGQNIKYLEIEDLKGMNIPIGPARQIVNECKNMMQLSNKLTSSSTEGTLETCSSEQPVTKTNIKLSKKRKRPNPQRVKEPEDVKKNRLKLERLKKRQEKEQMKHKQLDNKVQEHMSNILKSTMHLCAPRPTGPLQESENSDITKHLVKKDPSQLTCPKLHQQDKEAEMQMSALMTAKPSSDQNSQHASNEYDEEEDSSQNSLKSDEPYV